MDISTLPPTARAMLPTPLAHSDVASILAALSRDGAHFTVDGFDVSVDVLVPATPPTKTPNRIALPAHQRGLPVAGVDDRVALATLHGAGAPTVAATAHQAIPQALFSFSRPSDDLSLPVTERTLAAFEQRGLSLWVSNDYNARPVSTRDACLAVRAGKNDRMWVGRDGRKLAEIPVARLQTDPNVATEVLDRVDRYERLNAVRRDASLAERALRLLDEPVGRTTLAEREAAMIQLLTIRRGSSGGEEREYRAVMGAMREGETPVEAVRDFGRFITTFSGRDRADDVINGWPYYRTLPADAATHYLNLLARAQNHASARIAYDTIYADGKTEMFPEREKSLAALFATEGRIGSQRGTPETGKQFAGAAEMLALVAKTLRPDETLDGAASRYTSLEGRVWSVDEAHEAFTFMRRDLTRPSSVPLREREAQFISLLDGHRDVEAARRAWALLTVDDRRESFDIRKAQLDRLVARRPAFEQATTDLQKLEDATATQGGLESTAAARLFRFVEVSSNFEEARAAIDLVDHAALPTDATVREQIYLTLADARQQAEAPQTRRDRTTGADVKDDYWYVVRTAGAADPAPVAEQYGRLLKAAHGDTDEARVAQSVVRHPLSTPNSLGAVAARREAWLTRFLERCGKTSDACEAMRFIESAPSVAEAERRADTLDGLVKMAMHFRSDHPVSDAVGIMTDLQARPGDAGPVDEAASLLACLAERIPSPHGSDGRSPLDRVRAQLMPEGLDLGTLVTDLRGVHLLLDRVTHPWNVIEIWPEVNRVPAGVSHGERAEALGTLAAQTGSSADLVRLYATASEGTGTGDALRTNADILARMLPVCTPSNAIDCYNTIHEELARAALVGEPADSTRAARYADLVTGRAVKEDLEQIFDTLRVPVGAEPLADRETAFTILWNAERAAGEKEVTTEALRDFETVAATLYPGDGVADGARLFVEVLQAIPIPAQAREATTRLQADRLAGDFPALTTRQLVERFLEAYVVNPDIDAAMAALHRTENDPGTVVNGPDEVVVGGIKVPKRKD